MGNGRRRVVCRINTGNGSEPHDDTGIVTDFHTHGVEALPPTVCAPRYGDYDVTAAVETEGKYASGRIVTEETLSGKDRTVVLLRIWIVYGHIKYIIISPKNSFGAPTSIKNSLRTKTK